MKTYYLTLSQTFPATHPRKGEPTDFRTKLLSARYRQEGGTLYTASDGKCKLHTIRANYPFWAKRFEQINAGEAVLSVRQWSGKPYRSKMIEICRLTKDDGIGIQRLKFASDRDGQQCWWNFSIDGRYCHYDTKADYVPNELAENDGLSYKDWQDWFRNYDLSKPLAIIHFTNFRY
ncbi:MAG: hypothetical protein IJT35_04135 [Paludibacteraceae bacterium]|nr:hypothetical protein [Paludibacteraceae bacterium]